MENIGIIGWWDNKFFDKTQPKSDFFIFDFSITQFLNFEIYNIFILVMLYITLFKNVLNFDVL